MRIPSSLILLPCLLLAACGQTTQMPAQTATATTLAPTEQGASATPAQAASPAPDAAASDPAAAKAMDARVERVLGEASAYRAMVASLKQAVAAQDAAAVAALVHYPLEARIGGERVEVNDAAQFQAQYAQLMAPEIVRAIQTQDYDRALVNQQGIMLGDGQVWISGVCAKEDCSDRPAPQVVTLQTTSS